MNAVHVAHIVDERRWRKKTNILRRIVHSEFEMKPRADCEWISSGQKILKLIIVHSKCGTRKHRTEMYEKLAPAIGDTILPAKWPMTRMCDFVYEHFIITVATEWIFMRHNNFYIIRKSSPFDHTFNERCRLLFYFSRRFMLDRVCTARSNGSMQCVCERYWCARVRFLCACACSMPGVVLSRLASCFGDWLFF